MIPAPKTFTRAKKRAVVVAPILRQKRARAALAHQGLTPAGPPRVHAARVMQGGVVSSRQNNQVVGVVVSGISVAMVDNFVRSKGATKGLAGDKPVFCDVAWSPCLEGIRMVWPQQVDVAIGRLEASASPPRISLPARCMASHVARGDSSGRKAPHGGSARRRKLHTASTSTCH